MESSAWLSGSNRATRLALSPRQLNGREGAPLRPSAACRRLTSIALWQSRTASLLPPCTLCGGRRGTPVDSPLRGLRPHPQTWSQVPE